MAHKLKLWNRKFQASNNVISYKNVECKHHQWLLRYDEENFEYNSEGKIGGQTFL